jgi:hypothetical protein
LVGPSPRPTKALRPCTNSVIDFVQVHVSLNRWTAPRPERQTLGPSRWLEAALNHSRATSIPRLSRGRRRSQGVTDGCRLKSTCENALSIGAKGCLGSSDNAEADGWIPSSPTKDLMRKHFWTGEYKHLNAQVHRSGLRR